MQTSKLRENWAKHQPLIRGFPTKLNAESSCLSVGVRVRSVRLALAEAEELLDLLWEGTWSLI